MSKDEDILKIIKDIQKNYKAELEDSPEEDRLSFLDQINNLIRSIFNDSSMTVYDVFSKDELKKWKNKRFFRIIKHFILNNYKNTFYFVLLITITGFLVSEALDFYATTGVVDFKTYVKAILTEVCFIFLSGYRSDNRTQMIGAGILRVSIFCLMIFVITSKTFMDSTKNYSNTNAIQEQVLIIQKQITQKEKDIRYYRDVKQWPNTVRQLTREMDDLVKKLIQLKEKQADGATVEVSELIRYKAYGNAFFRVVLLFISILITRRIFSF
jgi:hypothetical protein